LHPNTVIPWSTITRTLPGAPDSHVSFSSTSQQPRGPKSLHPQQVWISSMGGAGVGVGEGEGLGEGTGAEGEGVEGEGVEGEGVEGDGVPQSGHPSSQQSAPPVHSGGSVGGTGVESQS